MSHQTTVKCEIKSDTRGIAALKLAAEELGCKFLVDSNGRIYNGSARADYVVQTTGSYDVLCTREKNGTLGLATDFYGGSVQRQCGKDLTKLTQLYKTHRTIFEARAKGYSVSRVNQPDGTVKITVNV